MITINITCEGCDKTHKVRRTPEIPDHVVSMGCNWCPVCEDKAEEHYEEWYNESDGDNGNDDIPPNQLCMPFEMERIIGQDIQE